jgi:hypothetical protein
VIAIHHVDDEAVRVPRTDPVSRLAMLLFRQRWTDPRSAADRAN